MQEVDLSGGSTIIKIVYPEEEAQAKKKSTQSNKYGGEESALVNLVYNEPPNRNSLPPSAQGEPPKYPFITPPASGTSSAQSSMSNKKIKEDKEKRQKQKAIKAAKQNNDNKKKEKKEKTRHACSKKLCCFFFFSALLSIVIAAVLAHMLALNQLPSEKLHTGPRGEKLVQQGYNMSYADVADEDLIEKEDATKLTSNAQVMKDEDWHMNTALKPALYQLSVKIFVPDYAEVPKEKAGTYEAVQLVTFDVDKETDKIELHADGLIFDQNDLSGYQIFDGKENRPKRDAEDGELLADKKEERPTEGPSLSTTEEPESTSVEETREDTTLELIPETTTAETKPDEAPLGTTPETTTFETAPDATPIEQTPETTTPPASTEETHEDTTLERIEDSTTMETSPDEAPLETSTWIEQAKDEPKDIHVKTIEIVEATSKVIFHLDKSLSQGERIVFRIPFSGPIRSSTNGLYSAPYRNAKGENKTLAMTHFDPQFARRFVPCFDEPKYKAPWSIEITHPSETTASSNGEVESVKVEGGWKTTSFQRTPPMSTYLMALAVTEFISREGTSKSGKKIRVWAQPSQANLTDLALDSAVKLVDHFEDLYGIPLPVEKEDIYAMPRFEAGAMENWGLLFFREESLLYSPSTHSLSDKRRTVGIIAHELAHQWFGDLVSVEWFNDLWLKEGFATYYGIEHPGEDINNPQLDSNSIIHGHLERALKADGLSTSHPISFKVNAPNEINSIYDPISYSKGYAVLRMLRNVVGEELFQQAIRLYLKKYSYGTATAEKLFGCFDEVVPESTKSWNGEKFSSSYFATNWIIQLGYPVVNVRRVNDSHVELRQSRFKENNGSTESEQFRNPKFWYKWDIPVWYTVNGERQEMSWLHEVTDLPVKKDDSIVVNTDAKGFYRVNYDDEGWANIVKTLEENHDSIPELTRARLISDAFQLASAGYIPYSIPLNLTSYLHKEEGLLPWRAALTAYSGLLNKYRDAAEGERVRNFIASRVAPSVTDDKINWAKLKSVQEEDNDHVELITDLLEFCVRFDIGHVTRKLLDKFEEDFIVPCKEDEAIASSCSTVPPAARPATYCAGISRAHEATLLKVEKMIARETSSREKGTLVKALGCTRDTAALKRLFSSIADPSSANVNYISSLGPSLSRNPTVDYVFQDYLQSNWATLKKSLGSYKSALSNFIKILPLSKERKIDQLRSFLADHSSAAAHSAFQGVLNTADSNVEWKKLHEQEIGAIVSPKTRME